MESHLELLFKIMGSTFGIRMFHDTLKYHAIVNDNLSKPILIENGQKSLKNWWFYDFFSCFFSARVAYFLFFFELLF